MKKKFLIFLIIIVIILVALAIIMKINKNNKIKYNTKILEEVKTAFLDFEKSNNYSYIMTDIDSNSTFTKLKKDSKFCYKEIGIYGDIETKEVYRYEEESKSYVDVSEAYLDTLEDSYYSVFNVPSLILDLTTNDEESKVTPEEASSKVSIEEEKYDNIECYKISYAYNDTNIEYVWINKETMLPIRSYTEQNNGEKIANSKYEITIGQVQDSEVTFEEEN